MPFAYRRWASACVFIRSGVNSPSLRFPIPGGPAISPSWSVLAPGQPGYRGLIDVRRHSRSLLHRARSGLCSALVGLAAVVALRLLYQPDASDLAPHRTKLDQLLERRDSICEMFVISN